MIIFITVTMAAILIF